VLWKLRIKAIVYFSLGRSLKIRSNRISSNT